MQASPAVTAGAPPRPEPAPEERTPVLQVLLGLFPFLYLGLVVAFMEIPLAGLGLVVFRILGVVLFLGGFLACLAGLLGGWLKGFPAWSFPYLGLIVLMSLYLTAMPMPGWLIFNPSLRDAGLLGWRAFVPVGIVALLGLIFGRPPWRPLVRLVQGIWQDWTRLAFSLYAMLPLALFVLMDEIDPVLRFWVSLPMLGLLFACAFLYLRYPARRLRFLWLLGGSFLAALASTGASRFYWQTHDLDFTTGTVRLLDRPVQLGAVLEPALLTAGAITLILFAPALVGLAHQLYRRITAPPIKPWRPQP